MGCLGCDARVGLYSYNGWRNPYELAGFIVTIIMLAALLLSSIVRIVLQRKYSVPLSRLLTLFAAVFFTIVTFILSIAYTAVINTSTIVRGRFFIITAFVLAFQLIALTLIRAHVGHLLEASLINTSYRRALSLFNILVIVLLAALVCVEIGLFSYALTFELAEYAHVFVSGSEKWTFYRYCVELSYLALYLFSLILTAPVLFAGLAREKTRKAFVFITMLAVFWLVILLTLQLAIDALYVQAFADGYSRYSGFSSNSSYYLSIDAGYYIAIAPILATFFQALVLITLMFVPSVGAVYDYGRK